MQKLAVVIVTITTATAQVVINEIQPVPPTGEPEWVELYNFTDTITTLTNFYLYDRTSRVSLSSVTIAPKGFAILTRDTDDLKLLRRIPPIARLYQVSLPTLNNTTESLFLATRDTLVYDSVYYDMRWGIRGRTFERIDPLHPGYIRENIGVCIAPDSATCGYDNSLSLVEYDVWVQSASFDSLGHLTIRLANRGRTLLNNLSLLLRASRPNTAEWKELGRITAPAIAPDATSTVYVDTTQLPTLSTLGLGKFLLEIVSLSHDDRAWNDTARTDIFMQFPFHAIVFNEIMYEAADTSGEYIELANTLEDTVYLDGLIIGDARPPQSLLPSFYLEPGGYVAIVLDTNVFRQFPELRSTRHYLLLKTSWSLSNQGETLYLANPNGALIDSVRYSPSWHFWGLHRTIGRSLEKLQPNLPSDDARVWSSSTAPNAGTPAAPNSLSLTADAPVTLTATPNPFSPLSTDLRVQQTMLHYTLPWQSARVTLRIFDADGVPIREIANGIYSGSNGTFLWDGRNKEGYAVGAGVYVALLEASDTQSSQTIRQHVVVVIGK